jgi:hypothetical protein
MTWLNHSLVSLKFGVQAIPTDNSSEVFDLKPMNEEASESAG